jgi:hypothetical protein
VALFGGRRRLEELEVELARTRAALDEAGALDDWQRAQRRPAEQQLARVLHTGWAKFSRSWPISSPR